LWQVCGFLWVLLVIFTAKTGRHDITEILLKVVFKHHSSLWLYWLAVYRLTDSHYHFGIFLSYKERYSAMFRSQSIWSVPSIQLIHLWRVVILQQKKAPVCRTVSAFWQVTLLFTQLKLYFDLLIMTKGCCLYLLWTNEHRYYSNLRYHLHNMLILVRWQGEIITTNSETLVYIKN
jgi:hypothetical protein